MFTLYTPHSKKIKPQTFPKDVNEKDLDLLLDVARTEYKICLIDDSTFQANHTKTYLWISTVMLAAFVAIAQSVYTYGIGIMFFRSQPLVWSGWVFMALGFFSALCVFIIGVDSLRGTGSAGMKDFKSLFNQMPSPLDEEKKILFRLTLLRFFDTAVNRQKEEINRIGLRLRKMSWLLLLSVGCACASALSFVILLAR